MDTAFQGSYLAEMDLSQLTIPYLVLSSFLPTSFFSDCKMLILTCLFHRIPARSRSQQPSLFPSLFPLDLGKG